MSSVMTSSSSSSSSVILLFLILSLLFSLITPVSSSFPGHIFWSDAFNGTGDYHPPLTNPKAVIRAVFYPQTPFVLYNPSVLNSSSVYQPASRYSGIAVDVFQRALQLINEEWGIQLSAVYLDSPDGASGSCNIVTKQCSGVIGALAADMADIAIGSVTNTYERGLSAELSQGWLQVGMKILVTKPAPIVDKYSFMKPFAADLWHALLAVSLLMGVVSYLIGILSPYSHYHHNAEEGKYRYLFLSPLSLLVGGDGDLGQKPLSGRILQLSYLFVVLIAASSYTANLAAVLTTRALQTQITSLEDVQNNRFPFCTVRGTREAAYFDTQDVSFMKSFMIVGNTTDDCIDMLANGDVQAVIHGSAVLEYYVKRDCLTLQVGDLFSLADYGFQFQPNSQYTRLFNSAILKMIKTDEIGKIKEYWYNVLAQCSDSVSSDDSVIRAEDMRGLFEVLGYFVAAAAGLALLERGIFMWNNRLSLNQRKSAAVHPSMSDVVPSRADAGLGSNNDMKSSVQQSDRIVLTARALLAWSVEHLHSFLGGDAPESKEEEKEKPAQYQAKEEISKNSHVTGERQVAKEMLMSKSKSQSQGTRAAAPAESPTVDSSSPYFPADSAPAPDVEEAVAASQHEIELAGAGNNFNPIDQTDEKTHE
jgi:ABC-type amino acid transport substrate-binding protein